MQENMKKIYNLFYNFPILDEGLVEEGGNVTYTVVYKDGTWERTFQVEKRDNGDIFLRQSQYDARKWGGLTDKKNTMQKEILQILGCYSPIQILRYYSPIAPTEEKMSFALGELVPEAKVKDYSVSPFDDSFHLFAHDGTNAWELIIDKDENIFLIKNGTNVPMNNQLKIRNILKEEIK